jgi:peptidoglycan/LPS O-acetylase OafA/YrhL
MVIAGHMWLAGMARYGWHSVWGGFLDGGLGVFIFFVISGYLITKLLLSDYDHYGRFSLKRFYYRRFFRIVPPLYTYVLFVVLTGPLSGLHARPIEVLTALTFTRNLDFHSHQFMFEHFWSLCIEEQFYLIWPVTLLFALHRRGRLGATKVAITLIVLAPLYRLTTYPLIHSQPVRHFFDGFLPGHMDALMFGCWASLAKGSVAYENLYRHVSRFAWFLPLWLFGISLSLTILLGNKYRLAFGETLDGFAVMFMLLWGIRNSESVVGRLLNSRLIVHIGVISYSIYIWQTYFLHPENGTVFARFPWSLLCIFAAAEFSWQTVERLSRIVRDRGERGWGRAFGQLNNGRERSNFGVGLSALVPTPADRASDQDEVNRVEL